MSASGEKSLARGLVCPALSPNLPADFANLLKKKIIFRLRPRVGAYREKRVPNPVACLPLICQNNYISMKLVKPLLFSLLFAVAGSLSAQDLHYTLFNMSPLSLNPANTGAFFGSVRVGGIYRGQWWAVNSERGYNTPGGYIDAPIIRGFRDQDWVGVGATLINDRSGSLNFTTNMNMLSASYHLSLGKEGNSVLTLGLQGGRVGRSFNSANARLADAYDGNTGQFSEDTMDPLIRGGAGGGQMGEENDVETDYLDFRAGLLFKSELNESDNLEVGVALGRPNRPDYQFGSDSVRLGDDLRRRAMLITAHARYEWALSDKWSAAPTAMFQTTSGANEINLQAWAGYDLKDFKPDKETLLRFGLGYRVGDAAKVLAGLDYGSLRVAASFDLNVSQYRVATDYQGAFEIAAYYIFKIYKEPKIKPAILCPSL